MCGIAGEIRFDGNLSSGTVTKAMCDAQVHRGPDDEGYYSKGAVSLGIRRLAVIDLTKGLYPLHNEQNTIHLVFNGEIYGFDALRNELQQRGHRFTTRTDAETIVHGYEEWKTQCLQRLNGMFAFALWDDQEQLLWMVRDHFGIKPLYYYHNKNFAAFASEIKPLLAHPDLRARPNARVIWNYLTRARVDDTRDTFFDGIERLQPAHHLLIRSSGSIRLERYWAPRISRKLNGDSSEKEARNTRRLFSDAVTRQLVSDVPVGTCLSGGIDSSSVICTISRAFPSGTISTGERIKAFSAVFPGDPIDENEYVKTICDKTGAECNLVTPTAEEFWEDLPTLVKCQEEPFISTSVYAQWRVMKLAKKRGVTVLLDGQGGDELLCGYIPLYANYLLTLWKHGMYHRMLVEGIRSIDLISPLVRSYIPAYFKRLLAHENGLPSRAKPVISATPTQARASKDDLAGVLDVLTSVHGLPSLLRYEDKNSMWHSIEARVPFLDRPFFEYVASLPLNRKLRDGWTKYIFRRAMSGTLPERIRLRRSKIGFETPQKRWMDEELREQLQEFFSRDDLHASRFYSPQAVRDLLRKPKLTTDETSQIWRVLNLELWFSEFFGEMKGAR